MIGITEYICIGFTVCIIGIFGRSTKKKRRRRIHRFSMITPSPTRQSMSEEELF